MKNGRGRCKAQTDEIIRDIKRVGNIGTTNRLSAKWPMDK